MLKIKIKLPRFGAGLALILTQETKGRPSEIDTVGMSRDLEQLCVSGQTQLATSY
jgi:hypothetical protein